MVCGEEVKLTALKCIHCGSFQDWRRHVGFSSTVLALIVAILALFSPVAQTISDLHLDYKKRNAKRVEIALVEIESQYIDALVSNRSSSSIVIDRIGCTMQIPYAAADLYVSHTGEDIDELVWPQAEETIGSILIVYRPVEKILLGSGQQVLTKFIRSDVTSPSRKVEGPSGNAQSYCLIGAVSDIRELENDFFFLKPAHLLAFDALSIVNAADYSPLQLDKKAKLVEEIIKRRAKVDGKPLKVLNN